MSIIDRLFDPGVAGDKSVIRFLLLLSGVPILSVTGFWLVNARADASPSIAPDAIPLADVAGWTYAPLPTLALARARTRTL